MNSTILLNNRPEGRPQESDFKFVESEKPSAKDGEILLETKYVSVDPYLRGRMRDQKSYIEPFELNEPITSHIIAEVIETQDLLLMKRKRNRKRKRKKKLQQLRGGT